MTVQTRLDVNNEPLILKGEGQFRQVTVATNGSRSGDIVWGTVMAKIGSSGKWVPWTAVDATDGSQFPIGILYQADLAEADIQAGDIEDVVMLVGGPVRIDEEQITFENSLSKASVITVPTNIGITGEDSLRNKGIELQPAVSLTGHENS